MHEVRIWKKRDTSSSHEIVALEARFEEGDARIIGLPVLYTLDGEITHAGVIRPHCKDIYVVDSTEPGLLDSYFAYANGLFTISRWLPKREVKQNWWFPDT